MVNGKEEKRECVNEINIAREESYFVAISFLRQTSKSSAGL